MEESVYALSKFRLSNSIIIELIKSMSNSKALEDFKAGDRYHVILLSYS